MIRHIPHGGKVIPKEYDNFIDYVSLEDKGVLEIFCKGYKNDTFETKCVHLDDECIIFPIDRCICDVERFLKDEPMEKLGMGVCYEKNANLGELRHVSAEERNEIIQKYYIPHHKLLEDKVTEELNLYNKCLIIDCHTYRKEPWPYEEKKQRPEIDIGFNKMTPTVETLNTLLEENFHTGYNTPFKGSIVPLKYMNDNRVESIMLEVRQDVENIEEINKALKTINHYFYD